MWYTEIIDDAHCDYGKKFKKRTDKMEKIQFILKTIKT